MLPNCIILNTKETVKSFFEQASKIPVLDVSADEILWNVVGAMYVNNPEVDEAVNNYAHDVLNQGSTDPGEYLHAIWNCVIDVAQGIHDCLKGVGAYDDDGILQYYFDGITDGCIILKLEE